MKPRDAGAATILLLIGGLVCAAEHRLSAAERKPTSVREAESEERAEDAEEEEDGPSSVEARFRFALRRQGGRAALDPEQRLRAARETMAGMAARRAAPPGLKPLASREGRWLSLGPFTGAGRMTAVAPHPASPATLFAGAAGGGVWKSTDAGGSWRPLTDDLPSLAVGALAVSPANPDVLYVGTGEGGPGSTLTAGIGLLRSTDGGASWTLPPAAAASRFFRISVHPADPDELVAGTDAGALRSTDGGQTFAVTIPAAQYGAVTDVVRGPRDPSILYAASWCASGRGCGAGRSRVLRSVDGGRTWTVTDAGIGGAPDGVRDPGRIALAISPSDPRVLYAAAAFDEGDGEVRSHVYTSTDAGQSWVDRASVSQSGDDTVRRYLGGLSWYANTIAVSPVDPRVVVAGGVYYVRSTDGGATFHHPPFTGSMVHLDAHELRFDGGTLAIANDGGIWTSPDGGETAVDRNRGLVTRQYYALGNDPSSAVRFLAGAQDNGTDLRNGSGTFRGLAGSDGFDAAFDPAQPDVAYATAQLGQVYRSANARADTPDLKDVTPPYAAGPGQPEASLPFRTVLTVGPGSRLYVGTSRVWRSTDGGTTWSALAAGTSDGSPWDAAEPVSALAASASDGSALLVAKGPRVYRSGNGGASWAAAWTGLSGADVNGLEIDPRDPRVAYAALASTDGTGVFRTFDGGATWSPTGLLPRVAAQTVRVDPRDSRVVYAGTDAGVFRSTDGARSWGRFGDGLPLAPVTDLRVVGAGTALRAATYGRGIWELPLPALTGLDDARPVPQWLVAGMANTPGLTGTFWMSDLSLFNPDAARGMTLSLAFLDGRTPLADTTAVAWHRVSLAPRQTVNFTNVLAGPPFSLPSGSYGAIVVRGDDLVVPPAIAARTYNSGAPGGTFGLSVPAVPITGGLRPQGAPGAATLIGLREAPGVYRTNLVLANLGADSLSLEVRFDDAGGAALGAPVRVDLAPFAVRQLNRVLAAPPPDGAGAAAPAGSFVARLRLLSGTALPFAYATVIDERSSDPVVVTAADRGAAPYRVPGIVRTPGQNGALFRSDLVLYNPSSAARTVAVRYSYRVTRPGQPPGPVQSITKAIALAPRQLVEWRDVVKSWLPSGSDPSSAYSSSFVDIAEDGSPEPLLVFAQTYDERPGGTAGFQVPAFTPLDGVTSSGANRRLVMTGLATGGPSRSNVALFLAGDGPSAAARATLRVLGPDGAVVSSRAIALDSGSPFLQVNDSDLFGGLPGSRRGLTAVLEDVSGTASVAGYATVIDNGSGDAVLVAAAPSQ